jgi:hypothetical protein
VRFPIRRRLLATHEPINVLCGVNGEKRCTICKASEWIAIWLSIPESSATSVPLRCLISLYSGPDSLSNLLRLASVVGWLHWFSRRWLFLDTRRIFVCRTPTWFANGIAGTGATRPVILMLQHKNTSINHWDQPLDSFTMISGPKQTRIL